jgi:hemin uptake protein HemP
MDTPLALPRPQRSPTQPEPVSVRQLLRGGDVLLIEHAGELYRLRLTRNGKLILTK